MKMHLIQVFAAFLSGATGAFAAFGFTDTGSAYRVDSGANLVFDVSKYCSLRFVLLIDLGLNCV